ncbi:unnamed protein product [Diplocarpon coronariae]|uniref:Uncharacterized protein n=1 Tax=Diplocarpon coronariae TaxID=2795749 RepID=A0A218YU38_9HELO|nr:hypothetical protein B2J93_9568 [Marssonina coronariae]
MRPRGFSEIAVKACPGSSVRHTRNVIESSAIGSALARGLRAARLCSGTSAACVAGCTNVGRSDRENVPASGPRVWREADGLRELQQRTVHASGLGLEWVHGM